MLFNDLIGRMYEKYLSYDLSGNRKRGKYGIFYVPPYIAGYMCEKVLSSYFDSKSLDEILQARILDPSCGSGRFILFAYKKICQVVLERLQKGEYSTLFKEFDSVTKTLSLNHKMILFSNCIFGVDLDLGAVKVTKVNFLYEILGKRMFFKNYVKEVSDLISNNIRCGNSLISNNRFKNNFDWTIIGGMESFDIILSSPPYGSLFTLEEKKYLDGEYNIGTIYSTVLFMSLADRLLKRGGIQAMIIPDYLMYDASWGKIREKIIPSIYQIDFCGVVYPEVYVLEEIIYY
ncbi:MAG: type I restriction-modification system DNA methylase subunit, partial [Patescibacteria group bacterium]